MVNFKVTKKTTQTSDTSSDLAVEKTTKDGMLFKIVGIIYIIYGSFSTFLMVATLIFIYFFRNFFVENVDPIFWQQFNQTIQSLGIVANTIVYVIICILILAMIFFIINIYQGIGLLKYKKRAPTLFTIITIICLIPWIGGMFFITSFENLFHKMIGYDSCLLYIQVIMTVYVYKNKKIFVN